MKATKENYNNLNRCMYEFTGMEYWLTYRGYDNFFIQFYELLNEVRDMVKNGEVCRYNLVKLNGDKLPFIINTLDIF
jgi:hypothetical protein